MTRTLEQIKAEQQALEREAAALEKPVLEELKALRQSPELLMVRDALKDFADRLPSSNSQTNAYNAVLCLDALAQSLPVDIGAVTARMQPPSESGL